MEKGTILYIGNFELPDKNAAAHRVMNNGKIFRELGWRAVYLGTVRGERFDGVRVSSYDGNIYEEAYPTGTKAWIKHIFDTAHIKAVAEKYDDLRMIIAYNVPFATYKAVKKAFRHTDVHVAYDCTEWNSYAEGSLPKRLYKKRDERLIRTKLHKICEDIIVISTAMEKQYQGCNLLRLPPLVDIDEPIWCQERAEHCGVFEFCFAGTINNKERLDAVVQAFCMIDNPYLRLRIVGLSKEDYAAAFPEQKALIDGDGRLLFMGYVTHEESVGYVLSCDCYIFIREKTTRNEAGFPTKFAEAYTCGVAIISTDVSDIKQYADDHHVLIIDNSSCEAVHDAMLQMMQSNKKGQNARINKTFDYKNYVSETKAWISRISRKR